ncbi:putative pyruvate decarboxylase isozyme 2 [Capsicum annuum]|nr:putative pyruvate decarboxylase isozyme 2 [Capsicum annuum]
MHLAGSKLKSLPSLGGFGGQSYLVPVAGGRPELFSFLAQQLQSTDILVSHRIFMILYRTLKELSTKRLTSDQRTFAEVLSVVFFLYTFYIFECQLIFLKFEVTVLMVKIDGDGCGVTLLDICKQFFDYSWHLWQTDVQTILHGFSALAQTFGRIAAELHHDDLYLTCERWFLCSKIIRQLIISGFPSDARTLQPLPTSTIFTGYLPPLINNRYQVTLSTKARTDGKKSPSVCLYWELSLRSRGAQPNFIEPLGHNPWVFRVIYSKDLKGYISIHWSGFNRGLKKVYLNPTTNAPKQCNTTCLFQDRQPKFWDLLKRACTKLMKILVAIQQRHPYSFGDKCVLPLVMEFCLSKILDPEPHLMSFEQFMIQCMVMVKTILEGKEYKTNLTGRVVDENRVTFEQMKQNISSTVAGLLTSLLPTNRVVLLCNVLIRRYFVLTASDMEEWYQNPETFYHEQDSVLWSEKQRPCAEALYIVLFENYSQLLGPVVVSILQEAMSGCPSAVNEITPALLLKDAAYGAAAYIYYELSNYLSFKDWFNGALSLELTNDHPNMRIIHRKVALILGQWVSEIKGASDNKGKSFKSWRSMDVSTYIYCSLKYNIYGRYISVITVKGQSRTMIIIPENSINEWWGILAMKIETFINKNSEVQKSLNTSGDLIQNNFKEHVLMGEWIRQGNNLKLDWWSPTKRAFHEQSSFDWFWIRVHSLPLHLWNKEVMKKIGDDCGGWPENEEETELKNHLRWARIRGPKENILTKITQLLVEENKGNNDNYHNMELDCVEVDDQRDSSEGQLVFSHELRPLAIDDSINEEAFESQATLKFHINLLKLSQIFGVCTKGYKREFFSLIRRMGQGNSRDELCNKGKASCSNNQAISKELRNLIFNVKFKDEIWRPELPLQGLTSINVEEQAELEEPFEEEEILGCLKLCAMEKAPGPDGFPMSFYLTFWELLKDDLKKAIQEFYGKQKIEKRFNATFVTLIPKKAGATELKKDFRSISLIIGVCEIIAKLLAERYKRVIDKLVNKNQMAFIKGFDSLMRIALQNRWIRGFQLNGHNGDTKEMCHLLYADDTVIFCEPQGEQIRSLFPLPNLGEISYGMTARKSKDTTWSGGKRFYIAKREGDGHQESAEAY